MSADLIISGGSVITVDKENRIAEAVAVKGNKIIYVGKAISLKNRVRQYFLSSKNHSSKVKSMV